MVGARAGKESERSVLKYAAAESSPQSQHRLATEITPEKAKGPES